ncbi:MAG: hypothetical protein ACI8Y6_001850, partial [Brevundimonas sp.]
SWMVNRFVGCLGCIELYVVGSFESRPHDVVSILFCSIYGDDQRLLWKTIALPPRAPD